MRLDQSRAYATVYEWPGVRYQQDGRFFNNHGDPVETEPIQADYGREPQDKRISNHGWTEDDLRRPENKALKAQLEQYGEIWTSKKAALDFLQGKAT